ncbi:MAG: BolA family transcriptional regulator [Geminicoccaceae bacterium]|nr:MAG: BolA family transcriptional regulator [Geminicoccaceae bacterium]
MNDIKAELERRLRTALTPEHLDVVDESERHRGHAGYREGGNTHFRIVMRAQRLAGLSRIAQQRAVYAAVGDLMNAPIHALALDVKPNE